MSLDYAEVTMIVTEDGCAYPDEVDEDGRVRDSRRIDYDTLVHTPKA